MTKKEAIIDLIWCLGGVAFFIFFVLTLELNPIHAFVPAIIAGPLVFSFRYMTDHFGMEGKPASLEEGYRKPISRIIRTTPLLEWLWCHINYHQVHHHFPQIAHSLLPETYIKTKDLVSYQVEDGYIQVLKKIHNSRYYELNQRSIS